MLLLPIIILRCEERYMDYKTTLNLPETGFAMKASLATREPARVEVRLKRPATITPRWRLAARRPRRS